MKATPGSAWLCFCGNYEDTDGWEGHCLKCGCEPPWGCDCDECNDRYVKLKGELEAEGYEQAWVDSLGCPPADAAISGIFAVREADD